MLQWDRGCMWPLTQAVKNYLGLPLHPEAPGCSLGGCLQLGDNLKVVAIGAGGCPIPCRAGFRNVCAPLPLPVGVGIRLYLLSLGHVILLGHLRGPNVETVLSCLQGPGRISGFLLSGQKER